MCVLELRPQFKVFCASAHHPSSSSTLLMPPAGPCVSVSSCQWTVWSHVFFSDRLWSFLWYTDQCLLTTVARPKGSVTEQGGRKTKGKILRYKSSLSPLPSPSSPCSAGPQLQLLLATPGSMCGHELMYLLEFQAKWGIHRDLTWVQKHFG